MKRSIGRKFLIGLAGFMMVLAIGLCALASWFFVRKTVQKYEYIGNSLTDSIADVVDGDQVGTYLETGQPDEYYDQVLSAINILHDNFKCLYIYIAIPEEDRMLYIWSNGFSGEETIGFTTEYSPGGEEWLKKKIAGENDKTLCFVKDPTFGDIATAATPVIDSSGKNVALVCADFSVNEIRSTITEMVVKGLIALFLAMAVFTLIYYRYVKAQLVSPISELTDAAKSMTENLEKEEKFEISINTGDELQVLAESFMKMDEELREYISDNIRITAEKERIGTELSTARRIQESSLPREFPAFPDRKEFDLYATMDAAKEVGGDFYDFFLVDDDHLCIVMADVSGKSVPAALFMMISKIIISNYVMAGGQPAEIMENANNTICRNNKEMMFVTVWLGILELSTGNMVAVNAGHETPMIKRPGGKFEMLGDKHGFVVGGMEDMVYNQYELKLEPGSKLFLYTDGVPEATNANDELFGIDRALEALNTDPEAEPRQVLANVRKAVDDFVKDADPFDDLTMMCVDYYGPVSEG